MIRGVPLIVFALIIDGLQAGISAALLGAGTAVVWIPFFGQVAAGAGFAVALVINICISVTFGSMLIMFATFMGYRVWRLFPAFLEVIPAFGMAPAWTGAAIYCVLKQEGPLKTGNMLSAMIGTSPPGTASRLQRAGAAAAVIAVADNKPRRTQRSLLEEPQKTSQRETKSRAPLLPLNKNMDGIQGAAAKMALSIVFCFFAVSGTAYAQGIDPVKFIVSPEVPGPNQTVRIEVQGVGNFLTNASIAWQKDGIAALQGVGERTYTFATGGLGVTTRVRATITASGRAPIVRDFTFTPSAVNMIWEAQTTIPPLYRGKALYSPGSVVRVTAFPTVVARGVTISANNLVFQWSLNGDPMPSASGLGKNTFIFTGDQLRTNERVGVNVFLGGAKVGQSEITIAGVSPSIVFYSRDPLRGALYENALQNAATLSTNEITLQAEPYFFSLESFVNNSLAYSWKLNGQETSGPDSQRGVLTLRQNGAGAGQATLTAALQNTDTAKFLQAAEATLRIVFGQNNTAPSVFGI